MSIVRQFNKKTQTTYVYSSTSYYRPDKKRCYTKRKLLGKIDPSTGQVVPTGPRGKHKNNQPSSDHGTKSKLEDLQALAQGDDLTSVEKLKSLQTKYDALLEANILMQKQMTELRGILSDFVRNLQNVGISGAGD